MKKLFLAALMMSLALAVNAQSGMNSPYSQWGLGLLSDQTSGFNAGMNGVGLGFHEHNQVNYINPASYSSVDSLTFLFDAGISGQISNFNENGVKKNAKNANLDYVVAAFRAFRHMGGFGLHASEGTVGGCQHLLPVGQVQPYRHQQLQQFVYQFALAQLFGKSGKL